jgi:hypothetical protein
MKSVQINEIQQMVIEGDQDERAKHLFNNIHGLLEAKVLIKHLYSSGVQYLLDCKLKQTQFETNTTGMFRNDSFNIYILMLYLFYFKNLGLTHELKEIKKSMNQLKKNAIRVKNFTRMKKLN